MFNQTCVSHYKQLLGRYYTAERRATSKEFTFFDLHTQLSNFCSFCRHLITDEKVVYVHCESTSKFFPLWPFNMWVLRFHSRPTLVSLLAPEAYGHFNYLKTLQLNSSPDISVFYRFVCFEETSRSPFWRSGEVELICILLTKCSNSNVWFPRWPPSLISAVSCSMMWTWLWRDAVCRQYACEVM